MCDRDSRDSSAAPLCLGNSTTQENPPEPRDHLRKIHRPGELLQATPVGHLPRKIDLEEADYIYNV